MNMHFRPEGYNAVSPYFVVKEAGKLIELVVKIFDAQELRRYERPDGSVMHAEVKIDDSVLMFGESSVEFPPHLQMVHVYVADTDEVFEKAMALGCEPLEKPKVQEGDPDRRGSFRDFAGNHWSIGTQVKPE